MNRFQGYFSILQLEVIYTALFIQEISIQWMRYNIAHPVILLSALHVRWNKQDSRCDTYLPYHNAVCGQT